MNTKATCLHSISFQNSTRHMTRRQLCPETFIKAKRTPPGLQKRVMSESLVEIHASAIWGRQCTRTCTRSRESVMDWQGAQKTANWLCFNMQGMKQARGRQWNLGILRGYSGGDIREYLALRPQYLLIGPPRIPPQDSLVSLSTLCLFHTLDIYTEPYYIDSI